jgi:hypothetical protein
MIIYLPLGNYMLYVYMYINMEGVYLIYIVFYIVLICMCCVCTVNCFDVL